MNDASITPASPAQLAYAAPAHAKPRIALYRIAQACWALPLTIGLAILALYAITPSSALPTLGFLTMLGGGVLFGIGVVCLIVFMVLLGRCAPDERRRWRRRGTILLGLLALNILVAIGCTMVGSRLMSRFTITVVNRSDAPVKDVDVNVPGNVWFVGDVAPGASVSKTFFLNGEGDLTFTATHRGAHVSGQAGDYIGMFGGGSTSGTVTFTPDGATAAVKRR